MIDRTPKPCHHPIANHRHGTYACYTLDACRCLPCAYACSSYTAELRSVHTSGRKTLVPPGRAAKHVAALLANGWTLAGIASKAGVSITTVQRLNSPTRRPKRIKADVAAAILAVEGDGKRYMIDSIGVVRRIRALATLGWSFREIGNRAGLTGHTIIDINIGVIARVRPATYTAICQVYDELWDKPAPTKRDGTTERMVRYAQRQGWHPPMAWDDDALDDQDSEPYAEVIVPRGQEAADSEERYRLFLLGWTDAQIGERLGTNSSTIAKWRHRRGLFRDGANSVAV